MSALKLGIWALVVGAVGSLAILPNFDDWFPVQAAVEAERHDQLYLALMVMSAFIFALVCVFLFYSVWKFRARPGDEDRDGDPIHGNTNLEIAWTVIPTIIVLAFAVAGGVVMIKNEETPADRLIVDVTGTQYLWSFQYPDGQVADEMVLPVDTPTEFVVTAEETDVIHSFYVPQFRVKADAPPGILNRTYATPTREGRYELVCTELCGPGHGQMRAIVRVVSQEEFEAWLAEQPVAEEEPPPSTDGEGEGA